MNPYDTPSHTRGASPFVDDLPEPAGLLHAAVLPSPIAHGTLRGLDVAAAEARPGVVRVFTAADVPGVNQIGGIIEDEPLLPEREVDYVGQPLAFVVAHTPEQARDAMASIGIDMEPLPAIFDAREAAAAGRLIAPSRTLALGDVAAAWPTCTTVVEGRAESGGQEHLYLECQSAMAVPLERGRLCVRSATQAPTAVQRTVAAVLGLRMHAIEVDVPRLGGAFGGKEDQATAWACMAALAAHQLGRPVKLVLERHEDMAMTGKRHPYSTDFRLGLDAEMRFVAFEADYYQNAGAAADLSTAIMERTLFHATNSYAIPHVRVTGTCCRTHLPPNTAFRGFGAPQAMFVIESAITKAAEMLGVPARELQRRNLLREGDVFPHGMRVTGCTAVRSYEEAVKRFDLDGMAEAVTRFNDAHRTHRQGLAVMPVCFGISFTNTMLNQAGALVHVYTDGSVSVSTAAVEMGQGVNAKVRRIVAVTLGIDEALVSIETTNTGRVANMSPTAASTATDLNGMAAQMAAQQILDRLKHVAGSLAGVPAETVTIENGRVKADGASIDLDWSRLVRETYTRRINLSGQALYATPGIHYDKVREKGEPFAYHVFGTAITRVTVDVLRGTCRVNSVHIVHDAGRSLDELIDRGQTEGALVQGIGWMTMEELVHGTDGSLKTASLTTYKVPDLHATPEAIDIVFLENAANPRAVMQTKAIGEPPFMYGIGTYFAVLDALRTERPSAPGFYNAPMTAERILNFLDGAPDGE